MRPTALLNRPILTRGIVCAILMCVSCCVLHAQTIMTLAGNGGSGYTGDGVPAKSTSIDRPTQIDVDNNGSLEIVALSNNSVSKILDIVTISISPGNTVCPGTTVTLTADVEAGCGIASYEWYKNGSIAGTGSNTFTYVPANGDAVYCTVTTSGGTCAPGITASSNTIVITLSPWIATTGSSTACIDQTTTLTGTPSGGTWSSAAAGVATVSSAGVVTGVAAGTAELTYAIGASCYATITVTVGPAPNAGSISGPANVCLGKNITLTGSVSGGTWSSSGGATISTTGLVTGATAGTATITYTVSNGFCSATATTNITIHPSPDAGIITAPANVCPGANFTLTNTVSGGTWSSSNGGVAGIGSASGSMNSIAVGTSAITYSVGPDVNGCSATTTVTVNVINNSFTLAGDVTDALCYGDSTGAVTLTTDPADSTYTYSWFHGDTSATVSGLPTGSYSVQVTQSATQCKRSTQYYVIEPDSMAVIITVIPKYCNKLGSVKAEVNGGVPGYQFLWAGNNVTYATAEATQLDVATYTLTVTDANGCTREWLQQMGVANCNTIFPLAGFSPNGDGINDLWYVSGLDEYPLNTVQIFDKWGDQVYEHSRYENDWDGKKSNGGHLPDGTYYYLIKLNEPSKTGGDIVFKGTVTIKR
jgi:trimeric autotransporter adhesin